MTDHSFSDRALSLLDTMWSLKTGMPTMKRKLHTLTGITYTAAEIREAATRHEDKRRIEVEVAAPAVEPTRLLRFETVARRTEETTRLVAPGTFPANRFTMLRPR